MIQNNTQAVSRTTSRSDSPPGRRVSGVRGMPFGCRPGRPCDIAGSPSARSRRSSCSTRQYARTSRAVMAARRPVPACSIHTTLLGADQERWLLTVSAAGLAGTSPQQVMMAVIAPGQDRRTPWMGRTPSDATLVLRSAPDSGATGDSQQLGQRSATDATNPNRGRRNQFVGTSITSGSDGVTASTHSTVASESVRQVLQQRRGYVSRITPTDAREYRA